MPTLAVGMEISLRDFKTVMCKLPTHPGSDSVVLVWDIHYFMPPGPCPGNPEVPVVLGQHSCPARAAH